MNEILSVGGLLTAFGLSSATGLNAYLPLLVVGILGRTDHLTLDGSYVTLATWPVIGVLAVLFLVDLVGDKIPALDSVFHAVGTVIHPVAGALAFASQAGVVSNVNPTLALVLGGVTGGGFHLARSAVRPVSTVTTAGIGNPILSLLEDITSAVLTFVALVLPILVVVALIIVVVGLFRLWRRFGRSRRLSQSRS